jgi:hypothetical protein
MSCLPKLLLNTVSGTFLCLHVSRIFFVFFLMLFSSVLLFRCMYFFHDISSFLYSQYAKVLEISSEPDVKIVFQVTNLWLSNCHDPEVNSIFDDIAARISTYKLVPLTHQIFSRLGQSNLVNPVLSVSNSGIPSSSSSSNTEIRVTERPPSQCNFVRVLNRVVLRMCNDHPHHTLPLLFALAHEGSDLAVCYIIFEWMLTSISLTENTSSSHT